MKLRYTIDKYDLLGEGLTFKAFYDRGRLLNTNKHFKLRHDETVNG